MRLILPGDRRAVLDHIRRVRRGETGAIEYRIRRPGDGAVRWIRNTEFSIPDDVGRIASIGGVGQDVTTEKELIERQGVLVAELQHRTRNLLGVVRSISDRTAAGSTSLEDFRQRFGERLDALSRANSLLSRLGAGDKVLFDELLRFELSAHGSIDETGRGPRVSLTGPAGVRLRSAVVQIVALTLHELAANALRHGALASGAGRLAVTWRLEEHAAEETATSPWLCVDWRESGVAETSLADTPPRRVGFGRQLIERALPYQLKAKTTYRFGRDGLHCAISAPILA